VEKKARALLALRAKFREETPVTRQEEGYPLPDRDDVLLPPASSIRIIA
jgi:hypothetical protein